MSNDRIERIRQAEAFSHREAYQNLKLYEAGSWLSRPVKAIFDLIPYFEKYNSFRGLDLGCGVGRNCIPVLKALSDIKSTMDCVDILPVAIEKLGENAAEYGVSSGVNGILCAADRYQIPENSYDLILGIAILEHLDSPETLKRKLAEIRKGLRPDGIACFVINTSIEEHDCISGAPLDVQFEIALTAEEMKQNLNEAFSGFEVLKCSVTHYQYDTYREAGMVRLDTDVLTYAVRKRN